MYVTAVLLCSIASLGLAWPMLHIFQLEGYVVSATFRWIGKNPLRVLTAGFVVTLVTAAVNLFSGIEIMNSALGVFALALAWIYALRQTLGSGVKMKLAFTKRMQRLIAVTGTIWLVLLLLSVLEVSLLTLMAIVSPALPVIGGWVIQPVEKAINKSYFNDAKARLAKRQDLIKIGITGSYGKTSTKFTLAAILSEKYSVLATPSSFNTPMGITRIVREQLKDEHRVFIAEMGARHVGDIAELCELVGPQYGLITSVGKQHLETFFTLENIINTKFELIEALPADGAAFFADDAGIVREMKERAKVESYLSGFDTRCDVRAEQIVVGPNGSSFVLCHGNDRISVETKLLGRHNISNILLCCSAAIRLGVSLEQIKAALLKLEPVEHRLQLIRGARGLTIIDDAFNSNPAGAKAALDVIGGFNGRRVIITPGMVELGEEEEALNREFGRQMAGSVDTAILMGKKRTEPIRQGLLEAGFRESGIVVVETMNEAMAVMPSYAGAGDVLLFENDLPDNY